MEKVIHSLIKEDQTGFIKGRNASDNMRRLLHILDFADSHPTPCAVFSLDAEKAFDRLEWNHTSGCQEAELPPVLAPPLFHPTQH